MPGDSTAFALHPRLRQDCLPVTDLPLCRVLLMNDSQYPWLILVPRRTGLRELHQLQPADLQLFLRESIQVSRALEALFRPDKLNIAALGNQVPQLHVHHIARFASDPAWPAPVWGRLPPVPYPAEAAQTRLAALRRSLGEI